MRSEIIVTVKDKKGRFTTYDVEIPVKITAEKAARDIVEATRRYCQMADTGLEMKEHPLY